VRDLTAVVEVPALPMFNTRQDLAFGGTIRSEFVGHDHPRHVAQTLQQLAKEAFGRFSVTAALDQHIKHISVLINSSPEVVQFASDADENLVQKPFVAGMRPVPFEAFGVDASETQAPLADRLVTHDDTPRCQDQLDLSQAEAEAVIQPDRLIDDLCWKAEASVGIGRRAHVRDPAIDPEASPT